MAIRSAAARLRARRSARGREPVAGERDETDPTRRILDAIEEYVYVGEICRRTATACSSGTRARAPPRARSEARARRRADDVQPDDREVFVAIHDQAVARAGSTGKDRMIGADGVRRWVRDRGASAARAVAPSSTARCSTSPSSDTVRRELLATNAALKAARAEADRLGTDRPAHRRVQLPRAARAARPPAGRRRAGARRAAARHRPLQAHQRRLGHAAGDVVLSRSRAGSAATIREQDAVARVGGEEFLVLLDGMSDAARCARWGSASARAIAGAAVWAQDASIVVTASVGCALSGMDHRSGGSLLAAADRALYAAKRAGRDRVVLAGDPGAQRTGDGDGPSWRSPSRWPRPRMRGGPAPARTPRRSARSPPRSPTASARSRPSPGAAAGGPAPRRRQAHAA